MTDIATHGGYPPLFTEPREPVPRGTCEHCGKSISRYYVNGLYRGWHHVGSGVTGCSTNTSAEPKEVA